MQFFTIASFAAIASIAYAAPQPIAREAQISCPIVECLAALAPAAAICGIAAASLGKDAAADANCLANAANAGVNLSDSCKKCADELGVDI
ncbi:hypothetical protein HDZ31DRAFT_66881 [Schizophyllum fasciatum]